MPKYGCFTLTHPLAGDNRSVSAWAYCNGDPVNNTDPTGMAVIYKLNGDYIGHSSEGFTGDILIYTGNDEVNFSTLTQSEAFEKYPFDLLPFDTMVTNNDFTGEARSKIWTHVISQFEGKLIFDQIFFMNRINGGKIYYDNVPDANWATRYSQSDPTILPKIRGNGFHAYTDDPYESTLENIASSVLVHEWYSHGIKHHKSPCSHRHAYENVIKYRPIWDMTTSGYKVFVLKQLQRYTKAETKAPFVDANYIFMYNLYVK